MDKIQLSLASTDDGTQVHCTLAFTTENREAAIEFHAQLAALCSRVNRAHLTPVARLQNLLPKRAA